MRWWRTTPSSDEEGALVNFCVGLGDVGGRAGVGVDQRAQLTLTSALGRLDRRYGGSDWRPRITRDPTSDPRYVSFTVRIVVPAGQTRKSMCDAVHREFRRCWAAAGRRRGR